MKVRIGFVSLALGASVAVAGCHSHPDEQANVYKALDEGNLRSVMVSQDRSSGVLTLSGIVGSTDRKTQAEKIARQAAPDYTISDQIRIDRNSVLGMAHPAASKTGPSDSKSKK